MKMMRKVIYKADNQDFISPKKREKVLIKYIESLPENLDNILLLPPDSTRKPSGTGVITNILYHRLKRRAEITIMPATGTHDAMTEEKLKGMFGDIPFDVFVEHNWRRDTVKVGTISEAFVAEVSEGLVQEQIEVEINKRLLEKKYDLIISIGQVLPHEVVGMANYSKNVLVGCGGEDIINKSHFMGAAYGLERLIGRDYSPVRKLYDYAQDKFLDALPLDYILTVNSTEINPETNLTRLAGIFIGRERDVFEEAVALSQERNITLLKQPVDKFVVYLDPEEFRSTWVGCKGIYRTRLAVADGGEIIIIAPGLERLGEDDGFDRLIRKYGYVGRKKILALVEKEKELQENLAVPAHLIHGSSEGRFSVTYASDRITRREVEAVNFNYLNLKDAQNKYELSRLSEGFNTLSGGEEVYYIENPATGLWAAQDRFNELN